MDSQSFSFVSIRNKPVKEIKLEAQITQKKRRKIPSNKFDHSQKRAWEFKNKNFDQAQKKKKNYQKIQNNKG